MIPELSKVIEAIGQDIISLAHKVMENDSIATNPKTGNNTLKNSTLIKNISFSAEGENDIVIRTFFDNYVQYIEQGRAAGKMPPISALEAWAKQRGIPTDNGTLYAIANAIKRDGIAARPILATLEREIEQRFEQQWADQLFEALTTELTKYFN